jgi:hypothetical protein
MPRKLSTRYTFISLDSFQFVFSYTLQLQAVMAKIAEQKARVKAEAEARAAAAAERKAAGAAMPPK